MTVLASLTSHYGRLECRREVPPFGFTRERIGFSLVLSADGEPVACEDLRLSAGGQNR